MVDTSGQDSTNQDADTSGLDNTAILKYSLIAVGVGLGAYIVYRVCIK